jgi:DNA/RNA endonuclease G (NUC1)
VPVPSLHDVETVLLSHTHFSVLMRPDKRLAAVTALGIDGEKLMDLNRSGIDWRLDPRLPEDQQTGERVYAAMTSTAATWYAVPLPSGVTPRAEASHANEDSFYYTNAAPQAAKFNQGLELWLDLESYLLENAADNSRHLIVFTGPIFSDIDPCTAAWISR